MIAIFCYNTQERSYLLDLTVSDLPRCLAEPNLILWVDFDHPTPAEIELLKTVFHLDELAIEDCIHPRQTPKLETFKDYHFFIVHSLTHVPHRRSLQRLELHGFLADRYLITYHDKPIPSIDMAKKHFAGGNSMVSKGSSYLAYEILDQMIDLYLPLLDFFDDKMARLEKNFTRYNFNQATAEEYFRLSSQILELRRTAIKNQGVFYQLSHTRMQFIDTNEARLFKDIYDHVIRVVDMSEHYQDTLRGILDIHLSISANRVNQVVQFLTIIATIMLPLNVITGIYGMNFGWLPLAQNPAGFFVILFIMIAVAVVMLYSFRRRGWI